MPLFCTLNVEKSTKLCYTNTYLGDKMRIITGKFKAKKLVAPTEGDFTIRPTLDRVKEPLFSMIRPYLDGARVLDLFAGTGNLGLEAISEGASFAVLNDKSKTALRIISTNVRLTQTSNCVKITAKEYDKCLKSLVGDIFDIIFLDPPYATDYEEDALNKIVEYNLLAKEGIIVLESDKRKEINENIDRLEIKDKRTYGRVTLRVYKWKE